MAVIGGISSLSGTLVGVAFVQVLILAVPRLALVFTGAALLVVLYAAPGGIGQVLERLRDRGRPPAGPPAGDRPRGRLRRRLGSGRTGASGVPTDERRNSGTPVRCQNQSACSHLGGLTAVLRIAAGALRRRPRRGRRRDRGPARHQRRRQVDGAAGRGRPRPGHRRHGRPRRRRPVRRADRPDRGVGLRPHARRAGRVPDPHRRREPAPGDLAAACRPARPRPPPGRRCSSCSRSCASASGSWPATSPAASSRSCRWPWPSSPGPRCSASTSCRSGLAPTVVAQLCDRVRDIHAAGTTVVVVEQSVNVALLLAERAVFLEKGEVRFRGPTAEPPRPPRPPAVGVHRRAEPDAGAPAAGAPAAPGWTARTHARQRGPPRLPGDRPALRRHHRPRRRRPRRRPGHGRRAHRPQRRRQDHAVRRHLRLPRPRRRRRSASATTTSPATRRTGGRWPASAGPSRRPGCSRR